MTNTVVTLIAREKLAQTRAGLRQLPPIAGFAFGDGGVDRMGIVIPPSTTQNVLNNELYRKPLDTDKPWEEITTTKYRYFCTLAYTEMAEETISEVAIYDTEGDLIAIKNCRPKGKDDDLEMVFEVDYES